MAASPDSAVPLASPNGNNTYLSPLVNKTENKPNLLFQYGHIADHLVPFPKCFRSLQYLFIATGFMHGNFESKWVKIYVYLYRILLLAAPVYILGLVDAATNPLFDSISGVDIVIVEISFGLLILNVYITFIFCIRYFKQHWLSLLYHSLSVDLDSDDDYCVKCITEKFRKIANRVTMVVIALLVLVYIQWVIGNRYLQNIADVDNNAQHNFFFAYIIPIFWCIQIWFPLFTVVALLYIIGELLKQKSDILIGRIHASNKRGWKISSFISQHPYSSINSNKLLSFDSWWSLMDSYIKLKTEYNDISAKWNLYLAISIIIILTQSITVIIMLLQGSKLLLIAVTFSSQFIIILCAMFYILARLSKQSYNILRIISMTDFGQDVKQVEVLRLIQLIKINPCIITIYGAQVTYSKAVVLIGTLISFISGSLTKYIIDTLKR